MIAAVDLDETLPRPPNITYLDVVLSSWSVYSLGKSYVLGSELIKFNFKVGAFSRKLIFPKPYLYQHIVYFYDRIHQNESK